MNFDDSLPSQSSFITEELGSTFDRSNHVSRPQSSFRDDNQFYQERRRSESPPPPPPAVDNFDKSRRDHNNLNSSQRNFINNSGAVGERLNVVTDNHQLSQTSKTPVKIQKPVNGTFPYLKRGSRKEPSALNRSPAASPSQTSSAAANNSSNKFGSTDTKIETNRAGTFSATTPTPLSRAASGSTPPSQLSRVNHGLAYDPAKVTSKIQTHGPPPNANFRNSHKQFAENGDEIILEGSGYWGLDTSITEEERHRSAALNQSVTSSIHNNQHNLNSAGTGRQSISSSIQQQRHNDSQSSYSDERAGFSGSRPSIQSVQQQHQQQKSGGPSMSITGEDWQAVVQAHASKQAVHREELDEFASLEQELVGAIPSLAGVSGNGGSNSSGIGSSKKNETSSSNSLRQRSDDDLGDNYGVEDDDDPLDRTIEAPLAAAHSNAMNSTDSRNTGYLAAHKAQSQSHMTAQSSFSASRPKLNDTHQSSSSSHHQQDDSDGDRWGGRGDAGEEEEDEKNFERDYRRGYDSPDRDRSFEDMDDQQFSQHQSSSHLAREEDERDDYLYGARPSTHHAFHETSNDVRSSVFPSRRGAERHDEFDKYDGNYTSNAPPHLNSNTGHDNSGSAEHRRTQDNTFSWGAVTQPLDSSISSSQFGATNYASSSGNDNLYGEINQQGGNSPAAGYQQSYENRSKLSNSLTRKLSSKQVLGNTNRSVAASSASSSSGNNNSSTALETTRSIRPVSALHTPAPQHSKSQQPGAKANLTGNSSASGSTVGGSTAGALDAVTLQKMRDLEEQMDRYQSANEQVQTQKRKLDLAEKELAAEKEKVRKWGEEERAKVTAWCEQQKASANKEIRRAAKIASESRLTAGIVPIRKEKAEIEALQATLEKMKMDHDQAGKKHRANENRLQGLVNRQLQQIEDQEKMLMALEEDRQALLEFVEEQGLRLPKALRARIHERVLRAGTTGPLNVAQVKSKILSGGRAQTPSKYAGEKGYVEEVDVQMVRSSSRTVPAAANLNNTLGGVLGGSGRQSYGSRNDRNYVGDSVDQSPRSSYVESDEVEEDRHYRDSRSQYLDESVDRTLADAIFNKSSSKAGTTSRHSTAAHPHKSSRPASSQGVLSSTAPGEIFNQLSNNIRSSSNPRGSHGALSRTVQNSSDFEQPVTRGHDAHKQSNVNSLSRTGSQHAQQSQFNSGDLSSNRTSNAALTATNTSASWARSSRSSRYSHDDDGAAGYGVEADSYEMQQEQQQQQQQQQNQQRQLEQQQANRVSGGVAVSRISAMGDQYASQHSIAKSPTQAPPPAVSTQSYQQQQQSPQQRNNLSSSFAAPSSNVLSTAVTQPMDSTQLFSTNQAVLDASGVPVDNSSSSRTEVVQSDGSRLIHYRNGTKKKVMLDGSSVVLFSNGDSKHTESGSGVVIYYYKEADTTHTTYPDKTEVYEFPNKQIEKHYPDGVKEITFPDLTRKVIFQDGVSESHFPDGVILREHPDGRQQILETGEHEQYA